MKRILRGVTVALAGAALVPLGTPAVLAGAPQYSIGTPSVSCLGSGSEAYFSVKVRVYEYAGSSAVDSDKQAFRGAGTGTFTSSYGPGANRTFVVHLWRLVTDGEPVDLVPPVTVGPYSCP